ncbi:MAG: Ig-like domain repeat protein, partial [Chitinophagaceae bacterium]
MRSCVQNIIALLSVRIKRDHLSFTGAGKVFFGFLFSLAFGFNARAQTATTTVLTSSANSSCLNDAITLTATIDESSATGNVQFLEGATVLGTATLDGNGIATLTFSTLSAGNHSIIAVYEGEAPFDGSTSSAINHFVNSPVTVTNDPTDKTAAIGCSATFSVIVSGTGPFTYQWRRNGANIFGANAATLTINTITSTDAGNYDVVVSNICGDITSNAASLTLLPSLDVMLTSQTNILCFGSTTGSIDITAHGGVAPYTYAWTGTGVNANAEDQSGLAAGTYSVTVTDANGCSTAVLTVTITQPDLIIINTISSNGPICAGNTLDLFSSASGGTGILNYSWSGPNGFTSALQNPSITNVSVLANGTYTLTVTDENTCAVPKQIIVTVVQPSTASISYAASGFCKNSTPQPVNLSGTGTYTGGTYSSFPAGLSINSGTGVITPATSTAGTYTVTYTKPAINVCGNISATTTVTITAVPVATFSYPGTPFCQNQSNPIPAFSGGGFAGNFTSTAGLVFVNSSTGEIDIAASTPGTYTVTNTIAAANGCTMVTATSSITITATAAATINYAGSPFCKSIAASQPVTITGTGLYTGGTYSSSPSGLNLNAVTGAIIPSASVAGTYTVTYNKAAAGGCGSISATTSVTISTLPAATITYGASQWCSGIAAPQAVTRTGTPGGVYSSVPAGLGIDPVTGEITPSNSTPGAYTVNYTMSANGCPDVIATRAVTINATPTVFISSDYCAGGGSVRLTANATPQPVTYLWSNGATTANVLVDKAGTYTFTATTPQGCSATSFTNVAQELVYNGDFSLGNTGFTSAYGNNQAPFTGGSTGLWPETLYAVDSNARIHHSNFFGTDHTTGTGNFMIVNGAGYDTTTVWRQSFAVQPNTTYYFSAWAMSLNKVSPYAQLKFTVNDSLFGTTAVLAPGANTTAGPFNWVRFFGTWNSNSSTYITISIVDLQIAAGGNDFGLDDISFGTLSPVPFSAAPSGSACEGQPLVLNSNVTGGSSPYFYSWTGPNNFTSQAKDPIIPNAGTINSGTYTLHVTDGYSCPITTSTIVTVGQAATVNAGPAQGVCAGGTITLAGTRGGSATSSTWSAPSGTFSNVNSLTSTYTPSISSGTVTLTLTTNDPAGTCPAGVSTVVITVSNATANAGPDQVVCSGSSVKLAGAIGGSATSATWSAPSGTFSNINSLTSAYTPSITSGTVVLTLTTNDPPGACGPVTSTVIVTVKPSPTVVALTPAAVCIGNSTIIKANNSGGNLDQTFSGASGTINQSIPDNNTTGVTSTITLSGAGALTLAATDNIQVSLNLTHGNADELDIFLVDPSNTRAMLLSSDNGGTASNYTNTIFNTTAANVIGSAGNNTPPFSSTYRPEGTISTAPDRTGAAGAGTYNAVIPASSLLGAAINGGWKLRVFDDAGSTIGTFISWSLSVTKSGIGNYTTAFSGPGTIGAVSYSGANNTTASTTVTAPVGNNTYTIVTTDAGGCTDTKNVTVTVNPLANVEAGGPDQVCRSANPLPITLNGAFVSGAATTGAWSIASGSGTLSSTAQTANPATVTFTPAANFNGTVTLQLTTNDPAGPCGPVNDTRTITVNALPVVNAGTYPAVCISAGSVILSGTPAGGSFSGPGVVGNSFVPATAGAGTHTVTYTYTNANGCPNSASTTITVNPLPVVSAGTYAPVCINNGNLILTGSPLGGNFGGPGVSGNIFNPVTTGVGTFNITYSYTNGNGCSAIATTSITVKNTVSTQFSVVACVNYTLPWGTLVTSSGNYVHTYTAVNGCDSVVTAHITINNAAATQFTAANCLSYTLPWGTTVTTSGNYAHTYQTIKGCDSVVTAHITINNAAATQFTAVNCLSYTLPWGTTVTISGDYVHTYQTVKGCDSVVTAHITINNAAATHFNATNCISYILPWGNTVTTSGNYFHTYQTVKGCDSVVTAHVTIKNAAATQFTAANCLSYALPWGTTVTTSGNYVHTYQAVNGCDSVVTAHITINNAAATQFTAANCLSYTLPWGTMVTTSGDYVHTYQTIKGCDSVVTAHITINNAAATQFTAVSCTSYILPWGTTVTTSGNYVHTYQTVKGCDSVVTAHITINNAAAA